METQPGLSEIGTEQGNYGRWMAVVKRTDSCESTLVPLLGRGGMSSQYRCTMTTRGGYWSCMNHPEAESTVRMFPESILLEDNQTCLPWMHLGRQSTYVEGSIVKVPAL